MTNFFNAIFRKSKLPKEEKQFDFIATLVADWALMVLTDAARPQESSWSDRTRCTVIGYLVGAVKESFPGRAKLEIDHVIFLAYQRLCSSLVVKTVFMSQIINLAISSDRYYLAGIEAAVQDYDAIRNKKIVHGFFDALQFPQDRV